MARYWISWDRLRETVGARKADALCLAFGGSAVYVPNRPDRNHRIAAVAGEKAMRAICAVCGGKTTSFPRSREMPPARVDMKAVSARVLAGELCSRVARDVGVSQRYVQRIAQKLRAAGESVPATRVCRASDHSPHRSSCPGAGSLSRSSRTPLRRKLRSPAVPVGSRDSCPDAVSCDLPGSLPGDLPGNSMGVWQIAGPDSSSPMCTVSCQATCPAACLAAFPSPAPDL